MAQKPLRRKSPYGEKKATMNLKQAADHLGVSAKTLKVWADDRQITHFKFGLKAYRFDRADVEAFKLAHKVVANSAPAA